MTSKRHDVLVFIGRFSPFHLGHKAVIEQALTEADKVIILVGSAYTSRNVRNPWTFEERKIMITGSFSSVPKNLIVKPLPDYPYNDQKWKASVRSTVMSSLPWSDMPPKIGLIGHNKDHTSYYLKMFTDWSEVSVKNYKDLNATEIRENMFSMKHINHMKNLQENEIMDDHICRYALDHLPTTLIDEYELVVKYKRAWESAPYAPTFVTVDAVVVQSSHVLLVKRKSAPGIGLWALPGGFLDKNETLLNGAIRELKEETKIKVPEKVLKGSISDHKTFDDPHRSTRGRTLTTAYFIELDDNETLPKVTGADDAEKAVWVPFDEVDRTRMFEDHFHIIDHFTGIG